MKRGKQETASQPGECSAERIHSGVPGLDDMLHGGYMPCTANLVEGAPGCGKSTLGMQFIHEGALHGEPGIILTFEQFPEHYYRDAAAFGWDFHSLEQRGLVKIIMSSPEVCKADLQRSDGKIGQLISKMKAKRILVESLSHFERISSNPLILRNLTYSFINALKREGLTAVLTRESHVLLGDDKEEEESEGSFSFLVDSYLMLRYIEIESAIQRAVILLKMRGSAHDTHIRQFEIGAQGMYIQEPFRGREGLMSGSPRQMAESFVKAFVRR